MSLDRRNVVRMGIGFTAAALATGCAGLERTRLGRSPLIDDTETARVLASADAWINQVPITITSYTAPRSPGGRHAYYSEGDYWWPDPGDPAAPFIRRDGLSNPDRFDAHRQALIRLSLAVPALAAAWMVSGARRYADAAERHLTAWFVTPGTRMAPHLEHAQAIIGHNTGRGIGIIDTLHLVEVALAAAILPLRKSLHTRLQKWFADYLNWMWTSPNGIAERDEKNNHGSCYTLQVAAFARLTGNPSLIAWCRGTLVETLVANQIAADGSQPLELARTKPYGYSLFNLDVLAGLAHLAAPGDASIWRARPRAGGGSLADALSYMVPFIADKQAWPHARDVEYWDQWPVRHPALLVGGTTLSMPAFVGLWQRLDPAPTVPEIIRNYPLRQPMIWFNAPMN